MDFLTTIKQSLIALKTNRLRTVFSVIGIVIGVAAVVIILSLGQGLKGLINNQVETFGPNLLDIAIKIPGASQTQSITSMFQGVKTTSMKTKDIEDLKDKNRFPYIEAVNGQAIAQEWASYANEEKQALIYGCNPDFPEVFKVAKIEKGRFFTESENDGLANVAVLGKNLADELFKETDPIGKNIKLKVQNYKIIGVFKPLGGISFGIDMNDFMYVPIETTLKEILGIDYITEMHLVLSDIKYTDQAIAEISRLLRKNHNITDPEKDDFQIFTMAEILNTVNQITTILNILLGFLAAISLLVGGIGIMNIMLASVSERTREIGLRKAIGATTKNILWQFLIESLTITGLGGLVGIAIGILYSLLIGIIIRTQPSLAEWPLSISWLAIFTAFFVATAIGVIFGLYPARKASLKSPIEALRYE